MKNFFKPSPALLFAIMLVLIIVLNIIIEYYVNLNVLYSILVTVLLSILIFSIFVILYAAFIYKPDNDNIGNYEFSDQVLIVSTINLEFLKVRITSNPPVKYIRIISDKNVIRLITWISWRSFGETITIKLMSQSDTRYEYLVSSRLLLATTTTIDHGKNAYNIKRIKEYFDSLNQI